MVFHDILAYNLEDAAVSVQKCLEFQQDNDPKHISRFVKSWLTAYSIQMVGWPAQYPDLDPIENLWNRME